MSSQLRSLKASTFLSNAMISEGHTKVKSRG